MIPLPARLVRLPDLVHHQRWFKSPLAGALAFGWGRHVVITSSYRKKERKIIPQQIANAMELGEVQTTSAPSSSAKPVQLAPSVATQHKDNQIGLERATVTPINKPPTTTKPKPTPPTETKHQGVKPHTQKPLVASLHSEKPQQNPKTSAPSGEQTKTQKQPPSPGKHSPENNQNLGKGESSEDEW